MNNKKFKLTGDQIAPIYLGHGGCIATDRITVDGALVGYMYRESPLNSNDSGWRFFAGDENDAYMSDSSLHGVYDLNTIVNYDPDILPYLELAVGTECERNEQGKFVLLSQ